MRRGGRMRKRKKQLASYASAEVWIVTLCSSCTFKDQNLNLRNKNDNNFSMATVLIRTLSIISKGNKLLEQNNRKDPTTFHIVLMSFCVICSFVWLFKMDICPVHSPWIMNLIICWSPVPNCWKQNWRLLSTQEISNIQSQDERLSLRCVHKLPLTVLSFFVFKPKQ